MMKSRVVFFTLGAALFTLIIAGVMAGCKKEPVVNWEWLVNGDEDSGGTSVITMTEGKEEGKTAYTFKGNITNAYEYGFVNVKLIPDEATLEHLKKAKGLSFKVIGDGDPYAVKIVTSDVKDYAYYEYRFDTVKDQTITVVVPVEFLMQPSWGKPVGSAVNTSLAQFVEYQTTRNGAPGPFAFKLWDFRVHTKGVPKASDLTPKGAAKPSAAAAPAAEKPIGGDLIDVFKEITLTDNFEYGEGYQAVLSHKSLFNGHKIVPGEKYTLKVTYSTSRDLEDVVQVALVDTTPQAYRQYWGPLSYRDGAKDGDPDGMAQIKKSKAGESVSATIQFTTSKKASGTSGLANALVFQTKGEGRPGSKGSGKQKSVKFTFTEFVFTKDN